MKKLIAAIAATICLCIICTGCMFRQSATGKNVKVYYTGTASVEFYPVCPECNHVSPLRTVNLSDGEYQEGARVCESCHEVYEISVDRR